jgi:peptidoglycan/xylan/chitin deacetylase (PgdA/CDA1 family)
LFSADPPLRNLPPNQLSPEEALARLKAERNAFFVSAQKEAYRSVLEVMAQHDAEEARGVARSVFVKGTPSRREIALTFDDGPHPDYTLRLLEILRAEKVTATFFVVGQQAERYPNLIRAERDAGHVVGNHTYHHVSLPKIPLSYVAGEIKACGIVIKAILGRAPYLFRPPGGEYNEAILQISEALGYTTVLWTDDPGDYARPGGPVILERTLKSARPGGVILLHDGIDQTVRMLPFLIRILKNEGFTFVTIDQMKRALPKKPTPPRSTPR